MSRTHGRVRSHRRGRTRATSSSSHSQGYLARVILWSPSTTLISGGRLERTLVWIGGTTTSPPITGWSQASTSSRSRSETERSRAEPNSVASRSSSTALQPSERTSRVSSQRVLALTRVQFQRHARSLQPLFHVRTPSFAHTRRGSC